MKKLLSEDQFQMCIKGLNARQRTIEIAYGVLVMGRRQAEYVASMSLTKGAVSQAVKRVWAAHMALNLPQGYEQVSVVLPERQAFIVKKWAEEVAKKLEPKS